MESSDFRELISMAWLLGIVMAITWTVFPFIVINRLNRIAASTERLERLVGLIPVNVPEPQPPPIPQDHTPTTL